MQGEYTESDETILLRKALGNKEERRLFQYFINSQSPEGSCPGRQVDYWLEVQRYKVNNTCIHVNNVITKCMVGVI